MVFVNILLVHALKEMKRVSYMQDIYYFEFEVTEPKIVWLQLFL